MAKKVSKKELAAAKYLQAMGLDLSDENFLETPRRIVGYLSEFTRGGDPRDILRTGFSHDQDSSGMVIQKEIPFRACCAHHLLPFLGTAAIGYIPNGNVVGLSKLARLVDHVGTRKPSLQEHITDEIADCMKDVLKPRGIMVIVSAEHTCMSCRGVRAMNAVTITSSVRGIFRDVPAARDEFMALIK